MALTFNDRAIETASGGGTGTLTLLGAVAGYQTLLAGIGEGNTCHYCIEAVNGNGTPTGDWEVGLGTVSGATLSRDTVYQSSNSDSLVSFSGTLRVFCTISSYYANNNIIFIPGDIVLGDSTLRVMYPQTSAKIDLGSTTKLFRKLFLSDKIDYYNSIATVANGIPATYAAVDTTGLQANVSSTLLYATPAVSGMYRVSAHAVITTAASVSSTLPTIQIIYTDHNTSGSVTIDATPSLAAAGLGQTGALAANTVGLTASGSIVINAAASSNINYQTVNYASTAAGMTYAIHIKLEAL